MIQHQLFQHIVTGFKRRAPQLSGVEADGKEMARMSRLAELRLMVKVVLAVLTVVILVVNYRWTREASVSFLSYISHYNTSESLNKSKVISYLPRCFKNIETLAGNVSETRARLQILCNQSQAVVITDVANKSVGICSLSWNDNFECLKSFVSTNCYTRKNQVVPDVVHYIFFGRGLFKAENFISVLSTVRFQQPCAILFHGPEPPYGPYWVLLQSIVPNLIHVKRAEPTTIFGKKFGFVQHKSDIVRLEVLKALGGIYLDNDQMLLRDVWELQNETFVMSREVNFNLANSMMLARPGAAFINLWYDQYRSYNPNQWGYFSTQIPWILAQQNSSLIKIVGYRFVDPSMNYIQKVVKGHYNITTNYGLHLYSRFYPEINLSDLPTMNSTLGEVWRTVLYGKPSMYVCPESHAPFSNKDEPTTGPENQ